MIQRVEAAFEAGLPSLAWMDDATRAAAVGKMQKIENKIGYPEKWKSYDKLNFTGSYFADTIAARTWSSNYQSAKVGKAVDEKEWYWPASIVNASYNPLQNFISFPAGILQPPFFHREYPKAMNYGAMGMVMGHELTHGFDDSGRKFDGDGVMREWWAPAVATNFEAETQCVVKTYSALEVQPGVHVKGELTLGENIADFGGIKESYAAYQAWVAEQGPEPQLIEGLTNEQLFFVATAQSWCSVSSPEFEELLVSVDSHSPPKFRVNVPMSHLPGFWDAFSCSEGQPMHPEQVCSVW
jgi:endothelin-converting enzyme/putative endopeptidase